MKSIAVSVLIGFLGLTPVSGSAETPRLSAEERSKNAERELQNTPLQLGPDCEPKSFIDKIRLKTLNAAQAKYFWLGQRYAVERSYNNELKRQQIEAINNVVNSQIAALEAQRTDATLAALGVRPLTLPPSVVQSMQEISINSDQLLAEVESIMKQGNYNYFIKCRRYADDRSK